MRYLWRAEDSKGRKYDTIYQRGDLRIKSGDQLNSHSKSGRPDLCNDSLLPLIPNHLTRLKLKSGLLN
jgi:hypothetical protein